MAGGGNATRLPWYSIVTGAFILIGFAWLAHYMIAVGSNLGKEDQFKWDRLLLIFNVVQTITVAAGGALLGTTVQATATKERVADANDRAKQAENSARQSLADAAKAEAARRLLENLGGVDKLTGPQAN